MQVLRATDKPNKIGPIELNTIPEFNLSQLSHDHQSWQDHRKLARAVRSALAPGSLTLSERESRGFVDGSADQKVNRVSDYASAILELVDSVDLPRLHKIFSSIIYRHRDRLEPKVSSAIEKVFSGARELVDGITDDLKKLPIPKFEFKKDLGAQPQESFWRNIKNLGLNTEF